MDAIYLDYAATTPVDSRVAKCMGQYLDREGSFGNPASRQHLYGRMAAEAVEKARRQVADLIAAQPAEVIWTSGATESNNLALKGVADAYRDRGRHIISMKTEHKSVVDSLRFLERQGWRVTWLEPDQEGRLSMDALEAAITGDTVLVSVMMVNNETGVIQDIKAISGLAHSHGVLLHVDAVQAVGKLSIDVEEMGVDLLSLSGHKIYGPKGIGALYVRRRPRVRVTEQIHGGGHERGMRSGTLPVHQLVGLGEACRIAQENQVEESIRITGLRDRLWTGLSGVPGIYRNGSEEHSVCNILNISVAGVDGEALHAALAGMRVPLAISSGSACTAESQESSYVLRALGRADELAYASIRFSLGRWTTVEEIDLAITSTTSVVNALRSCNPLWAEKVEPTPLELAASHPDYSHTVWSYFCKALSDRTPAVDELIRVQTPGSRAVLALHENGNGGIRAMAYGCVSTLAVSAWLTEQLKSGGVAGVTAEHIYEALGLAVIKRHCALQAEDALERLALHGSQNTVTAEQAAN